MPIAIKTNAQTVPPMTPVAFLGLGVMGYPMAAHLVAAGHPTTVYNRTESKARQFCDETGAQFASTPAQAGIGAAIIFCCVGADDDVREMANNPETGAFVSMQAGSVFVDHTTTSATLARELSALAVQKGLHFVDAPVSGGQAGAQKGTLTVMCGGESAAFELVKDTIGAYGKSVKLIGPSGSGQLSKMVNQIAIAGVVQGLAEAIAFGQNAGLDMDTVLEVVSKGAAQSWQMDNRGATMLQGKFDFGFAVNHMRKDLGLMLHEARSNGSSVPLASLVDQFYADVQANGGSRLDTSSLITRLGRTTQPNQ